MEVWKLEWNQFEMPDGLPASWAYDKTTDQVHMSVDDEGLPDGVEVPERMAQCYDHFFKEIYPTSNLKK